VSFRRVLYDVLDPKERSRAAAAFRYVHHAMVMLGIVATVLLTTPQLGAAQRIGVALLLGGCVVFFALHYLLRLYVVPEAPWAHPGLAWRDRRHWLLSSSSVVDLCSTWPIVLCVALPQYLDSTRLTSVLWLFKFVPYSAGLSLLATVIRSARSALLSVLLTFWIVMLVAGTLAFIFEHEAQPDTFGSIPSALWWTVVTLTTTGYGDAVPVTVVGRILAGGVMICGIGLFALWTGILANGFAEEIRRRDLLRTWDLVTKVPMFNEVGDGTISEVTRLLRPREIPEGHIIMRRGEPGDCMYFLVSGEVEIRVEPPVRLGPGDFFGEIALITGGPRTATAVATKHCVMLMLHVTDFRLLAGRRPELTEAINREAARRLGMRPVEAR
jgi:voltage-gated potassium channel